MRSLPVCAPCAVAMVPERNGVYTDFGNGSFLKGDRLRCPECDTKIVTAFCREFFEVPADAEIKPDVYQRVRQPDFPDYKPRFHNVLKVVK